MADTSTNATDVRALRADLHQRIQRATDLPMLLLSIAFIVVIIWPIASPHLHASTRMALTATDDGIWAAFALEYAALVATAPNRRRYVVTHVPDLLMVLLPMIRPLRLLRVLRLGTVAMSGAQRSRHLLVSRAPLYAAGLAALAIVSAAVMELNAEQHAHGARIVNMGDAMWWAVTTMTTVGYGDFYPVTAAGKVIAASLMLTGIGLIGVITASVAAWFIGVEESETMSREARLEAVVARLEQQVEALSRASARVET
ncbi:MAG: two pore domain potassium channel family protein [Frankiaceae bacterium]|nr:two pore domain potassium channel family protein [Frankiaceae bacterium]MBV9369264.1 two pore domain potassium channel family protein [Frankiales bacterium]